MPKKRLLRLPIYLLMVLVDFYGTSTSLFLLFWLLRGDSNFYIYLFINLMPIILLPSLSCLFIIAIWRKWHSLAFNFLPLIALIIIYGDTFIPSKVVPQSIESFTAISYNLSGEKQDFDSLDILLEQANVDIVALQEVTVEALLYLEEHYAQMYPYHSHTTFEVDHHGEVLLSRWSIIEATESRPFRSYIETPDGLMAVYTVHLSFPFKHGRVWQAYELHLNDFNNLLSMAQSETVPTLLIGDFNISQATENYRRLRVSFDDVFRETNINWGFTYPNSDTIPPMLRIDYIFASPDIIPLESRVIYQGDSDHFPLWARISFNED